MSTFPEIADARETLLRELESLENKRDILKSPLLKALFSSITQQSSENRAAYGQAVNALKQELAATVSGDDSTETQSPIDVTAPMDINAEIPALLPAVQGSIHPLSQEITTS